MRRVRAQEFPVRRHKTETSGENKLIFRLAQARTCPPSLMSVNVCLNRTDHEILITSTRHRKGKHFSHLIITMWTPASCAYWTRKKRDKKLLGCVFLFLPFLKREGWIKNISGVFFP